MARRYKPTFEEYVKMGEQLKLLNVFMCNASCFISQKVGVSRVNKHWDHVKFQWKMAGLKSELENMMYTDYPRLANTDVFYGERDHLIENAREIFGCKKKTE